MDYKVACLGKILGSASETSLRYRSGIGGLVVDDCFVFGVMGGGEMARSSKTRHSVVWVQLSRLAQIAGTRAEPQQIVAQRLLSCLQYSVPSKSSTKDLTQPTL